MHLFEIFLILLLAATALSAVARRFRIPYPTVLAVGGGVAAFVPGMPRVELPPDLILALFVAPVLLDAAYDASLRDLRKNWPPILSLVMIAVILTTLAVALTGRALFPDLSWPAAIALGALVAPPDAVAALTILRQVNPPHRIRMVLEGESLLNDATALLIYRLAVGAVVAGSFDAVAAVPAFALVVVGSAVAGWLIARPIAAITRRIQDMPSSVIVQFATTFGVWLLAEHLGLSGVVTLVVFALTLARQGSMPARMRVPSFAIWETATFVLNVVGFTLIGLQIRPILQMLSPSERIRYFLGALVILLVVVVVRIAWVMTHQALVTWKRHAFGRNAARSSQPQTTMKGGFVVAWSGMRGIVTVAAALALPAAFPHRDFIQVAAFVVVLGTLVIQGITLRPLLALLKIPQDNTVQDEIHRARKVALKAVLGSLDGDDSPAAQRLKVEYEGALSHARQGHDPRERHDNVLRKQAVTAARSAIEELRTTDAIGDDAYRLVEGELDLLELSAQSAEDG